MGLKFHKHYSLEHADVVLAYLLMNSDSEGTLDATIEAWSNGREQGYYVSAHSPGDDPVWEQGRLMFKPGCERDAARAIAAFLERGEVHK